MVIHKASSRGGADHGWLKTFHTFSFSEYYDPQRMNFGTLRVLNDDSIAAGAGFGRHPHRDMEIITIPLAGQVIHQDSEGNRGTISRGEIQVMSAGTGIFHSEFADPKEVTQLLQIWVYPKIFGVKPIYDQKKFPLEQRQNRFQLITSPDGRENSLPINQDAFFSLNEMSEGREFHYSPHMATNGVYVFVISGAVEINGQSLQSRDGMGIEESGRIQIRSLTHSELLVMEVPMHLPHRP